MITISKEAFLDGQIILIDKPLNWTSFQVVNKVRWLIRKNMGIKKIKVGHAGTLDPLATGLLIICCGKMTKQIARFQGQEKKYTGQFLLGATTPSYDLETSIDLRFPTEHIDQDLIEKTRHQFIGKIMQRPPVFSALKKDGKRLYDYARAGENVDIPKREVQINTFELDTSNFPTLSFKIDCSKGTYIRSIAHDFGQMLNSGAHLTELKRTQIGDFSLEKAISITDFEHLLSYEREDSSSITDS